MASLARFDARTAKVDAVGAAVDRAYGKRVNWLKAEAVPPPPGVLPTE